MDFHGPGIIFVNVFRLSPGVLQISSLSNARTTFVLISKNFLQCWLLLRCTSFSTPITSLGNASAIFSSLLYQKDSNIYSAPSSSFCILSLFVEQSMMQYIVSYILKICPIYDFICYNKDRTELVTSSSSGLALFT